MTTPQGWQRPSLSRVIRMRSGDYISSIDIEPEGDYPVYGGNGLRGFTDQYNTVGPVVLVGRQGAHCGNVHVANGQTWVSEHALRCFPEKELDANWLAYALLAMNLNQYSESAAQPGLSVDNLKHLRTAFPPLETQKRISRFLDKKTARIDGLIEKKRELLDRLAEKRQALITQAVTKGLNPDAPMHPSGIDWLGDIPVHWSLIPFKWRCRVQSGQVDPQQPEYAAMTLVAPDHIESNTGRLFQVTSAAEQGAISGKYLCPEGAVLYSKIRPALRKVALYCGKCLCSADMYPIDSGSDLIREYLFYFLLTDAFTSYAELESLRVAMPKLNREALGAIPIPIPSLREQREITRFCEDVDQSYRDATDKVRESIARLEEYRAAQVTAAVTGQLPDLR